MKRDIIFAVLVSATSVCARLYLPFPGWANLTHDSPDIVMGRPLADGPRARYITNGTELLFHSKVEVFRSLKGVSPTGIVSIAALFRPESDQSYLMFTSFRTNEGTPYHYAPQRYRFIPLTDALLVTLEGLTSEEQIKTVLEDVKKREDSRKRKEELKPLKQWLEESSSNTKSPTRRVR